MQNARRWRSTTGLVISVPFPRQSRSALRSLCTPLRFQGSWFTLACELTLDIRDRARRVPQAPPTSPLMSVLSSAAVPSVRKRWLCKTNAGMQCVSAAYHTMPTGHAVTICSALKASSKRGNADPAPPDSRTQSRRADASGCDARTPHCLETMRCAGSLIRLADY
jgi:hypothetical protein